MFTIEKNIPAPYGKSIYPFHQMEVGDSFLAKGKKYSTLYSAAFSFVKKHQNGWDFKVRKCDDGCRVWRVQ